MTENYLGTYQECLDLDAKISINCGWPNDGTKHWAHPVETIVEGVFSIPVPQGSHGFRKEQMNTGISHDMSVNVEFPVFEGV